MFERKTSIINQEKFIETFKPEKYNSKDEGLALKWINKAFDIERFESGDLSAANSKLDKTGSNSELVNTQLNKFNNSLSVHLKNSSNVSNKYQIDTQRFLFSLIRFDFLKNEDIDVNLEELINQEINERNSSLSKSPRKFSLQPVKIDTSFKAPVFSIEKPNYKIDTEPKKPAENTAIPQGTSTKSEQSESSVSGWKKYQANGGFVRVEIVEKLVLAIEEMKDNPPKISGKIMLEEKGFFEAQDYEVQWPKLDKDNMKIKESLYLHDQGKKINEEQLTFKGIQNEKGDKEKIDLYMYKFNPHLLKKSITPMIIEPKFVNSNYDQLNLRLLLNPKFKDNFQSLDLKIMTLKTPKNKTSLGINTIIQEGGMIRNLILGDFENDLSWVTRIVLEKGNKILGIWLIGKFNTSLFPKTLPNISISLKDEKDHFSEPSTKTVICDKRLIFDYQRKLINF